MPVPAKWLAPECLQDYQFSVWSDVWSYGITLWEIFTMGEAPWQQFSDYDVSSLKAALLRGERLQKPQFATQEM